MAAVAFELLLNLFLTRQFLLRRAAADGQFRGNEQTREQNYSGCAHELPFHYGSKSRAFVNDSVRCNVLKID